MSIVARLSFFLVLLFASAGAHAADADTAFEPLKARYFKLRNTDATVSKPNEWRSIAVDLEEFARRNPTSASAPAALFDASIALEKLADALSSPKDAGRAVQLLAMLVERYPKASLADDALLRTGDIYVNVYGDREAAQRAYQRIVSQYGRGDMLELAEARLRKFESGETKKPKAFSSYEDAKLPLVVIDPGHGGEDLGAEGYGGILEKDVVLDVAFATERVLSKERIARVRLTRRGDTFVPLSERSAMANAWEADLFLSLHTNASPKGKLSGLETYYLDMNGDEASRLLAERENASESLGGDNADLQFILSDLVQHAKLDDSVRAGTLIHSSLVRTLVKRKAGVKDLGVRKAPFYVLVGAHMPCVLLELLFIDNENDGKLLSRKEFRHALAEGIAAGVRDYFRETKKLAGH